jgi:hypothetical protein
MSDRPELERVVTEWLHESASPFGAERVLAEALVRVSGAGQHSGRMPWRLSDGIATSRLAIGGAAVVAVVVVAMMLSPSSAGPGASGPSPTTSASSTHDARVGDRRPDE